MNAYGQLGNGSTTQSTTPVDVTGLTSGVVSLTPGAFHACALTIGGAVKCWGNNPYGQLGNGTTTGSALAVDVTGLSSGIVAVGAGHYHSCALDRAGGLKCWGWNSNGQLGDGTNTNRLSPVDVNGLTSGVRAIGSGYHVEHTCALTTSGGVKCWGRNAEGQLGDGTTTSRSAPVDVIGMTSGIQAVGGGAFHSCAITGAGSLSCWGRNGNGQLGDGTTNNSSLPVAVTALSGVLSVAGGNYHTCAAISAGNVACWGFNNSGQIGDGTTTQRTSPTNVSSVSAAINAKATLSISSSSLSLGAHTITTAYVGDVNHEASNGTVSQQINPPPPPVVISNSPSSGPIAGGNSVTISGTNFTGATSVRFDTAEALFSVDSDTQITATAPAHAAGIIDITVTTPYGFSEVDSGTLYTYVAPPTVTALSPNAGPLGGGTTVVITGTNFTGATGVTFGGVSALSYSVVSDTQISALSPSGAGTVDVRVTTAGGTSAISAADQFTYMPAPTVTSVSPTAGPLAGGASVTITGTNLSGASGVTFGGVAATAVTVVSATQITATTPAHAAGSVDVAVTTAGGTGTGTGLYAYVAAPTLASVSPTSGPTTGGTSVTLTARARICPAQRP